MNKKIIFTLALVLCLGSTVIGAENTSSSGLDTETMYYPHANLKSAVAKYKKGNYTGCLQELFSLTKKDPSNALAYYYIAMAYTHLDKKDEAVEAYEKVIALNPNNYIVEYATKGRDCLTGGPACVTDKVEEVTEGKIDLTPEQIEEQKLDKFINAPYGNGLSPELTEELKQKELSKFQKTINKKENLDYNDIEQLRKFDEKQQNSKSLNEENIKIAQVSDEDIVKAVKTLKEAGLNLTVQHDTGYQDPSMAEMSMLLGNNSNNNNNMMNNVIPMLYSQAEKGENIDPRFMQAVIMNSMIPDFTFNNDNNRY